MRQYGSLLLTLLITVLLLASCASTPLVPEVNYARTVLDQIQRSRAALSAIQDLARNPQLDDAGWREELNTQMTALRTLIAEARALTPPESLAGPHQAYLDALAQIEQVMMRIDEAVAISDTARVQETTARLAEVEQLLSRVRERIGGE
jgi:hypothetical protein